MSNLAYPNSNTENNFINTVTSSERNSTNNTCTNIENRVCRLDAKDSSESKFDTMNSTSIVLNEDLETKISRIMSLRSEIKHHYDSIAALKKLKQTKQCKLEDLRLLAVRISSENSFNTVLYSDKGRISKKTCRGAITNVTTNDTSCLLSSQNEEEGEDGEAYGEIDCRFIENGCSSIRHFHFEMCGLFWNDNFSYSMEKNSSQGMYKENFVSYCN